MILIKRCFSHEKNSFGQKGIFAFVEKMFHKQPQNSSSQEFGFTLAVNATALFPLTRSAINSVVIDTEYIVSHCFIEQHSLPERHYPEY